MNALFIILLLVGVLCFAASAVNVAVRINLVALGLALVFTVPLIQYIRLA